MYYTNYATNNIFEDGDNIRLVDLGPIVFLVIIS